MNEKLQKSIADIVSEMAPPKNAVGLLTAEDVERVIREAATRGAMAGWVQGERTARAYWSRELQAVKAAQ